MSSSQTSWRFRLILYLDCLVKKLPLPGVVEYLVWCYILYSIFGILGMLYSSVCFIPNYVFDTKYVSKTNVPHVIYNQYLHFFQISIFYILVKVLILYLLISSIFLSSTDNKKDKSSEKPVEKAGGLSKVNDYEGRFSFLLSELCWFKHLLVKLHLLYNNFITKASKI